MNMVEIAYAYEFFLVFRFCYCTCFCYFAACAYHNDLLLFAEHDKRHDNKISPKIDKQCHPVNFGAYGSVFMMA